MILDTIMLALILLVLLAIVWRVNALVLGLQAILRVLREQRSNDGP